MFTDKLLQIYDTKFDKRKWYTACTQISLAGNKSPFPTFEKRKILTVDYNSKFIKIRKIIPKTVVINTLTSFSEIMQQQNVCIEIMDHISIATNFNILFKNMIRSIQHHKDFKSQIE